MPNQQASTVWLTGIPSAGKTTLAKALAAKLSGRAVQILDGDVLRNAPISEGLGFSKHDRQQQCRRVGWLAGLLNRSGVDCLVALVSPYESHRKEALAYIEHPVLVYVKCPVAEAQRRDVKGLYAKQQAGELSGLTGVDSPYEPPLSPDVIVDTSQQDIESCVLEILTFSEFVRGSST